MGLNGTQSPASRTFCTSGLTFESGLADFRGLDFFLVAISVSPLGIGNGDSAPMRGIIHQDWKRGDARTDMVRLRSPRVSACPTEAAILAGPGFAANSLHWSRKES
jgi:hypothetical protein